MSFLDDECGVGSNIRNGKSTCAVRHIFAVGITDEVSIGVGHEELYIGDRFICYGVNFFHQNAALGLIAELQRHDRVALDLDALRGIVEDIAILGANLFGNDRHARSQAINANGTGAVGHILTVGRAEHAAIRIRNKKFNVRNGRAGDGVLFDDQQRAHLIIAEGHGDDVLILTGEINGFCCVCDHIPVRSRNFLADVSACFEAGHNDGSIARSVVLADDRAARTGSAAKVADAEPRALQRLTALAVHLADDDGGKRRVLKG